MWIHSLKCSLVVVSFAYAFFIGLGNVSAGAYDGAGTSALSSTALEDTENIPDTHDRHKGIRSYDSTGFPHDNANRGMVKSYGTPSGHGASHDHGIKGGDHGYNKNDDCSKCKWENDDYWERDEPEEEGDENDGDECDDGQYRPDKVHHHGPGRGRKPGSHPSGVHKTGPTGVYVDGGSNSPSSNINYPGTGYSRPIIGYESTPKPGPNWNTPFADASKPGYGSVGTGAFATTPSSWPDWNRGTTPGSLGSTPKSGDGGHGKFPSSPGFGAPISNFATTKPGQGWINQFPSSSSAVPHTGSGISSSSYGNPQENRNRPYGQSGTQSTYAGAYAGATSGSSYGGPSNFGRKDHPFDFYKPTNTQASQGPYSGTAQASSNTNYDLGGYNKSPGLGSYNTPTILTNTFGTTKVPYEGIGSPRTVSGAQTNLFAPRKSPGSSSEHPGITKPSYASTTSWLGQTGSGSDTWHGTGTTSHTGFPTSNIGFGTTKSPFSHVNIPSFTLSAPYDRTGLKQPNFNVASSSANANAGANVFGKSPDIYNTPSITGITSYSTTPAYRGNSNYSPGVKGSGGSIKPAYGTIPHSTYPNIASGTWPGGQPGSNTGPWSSGKPEDGSIITPDRYSPGVSGILSGKQPQGGSGTWPVGQTPSVSRTRPSKQPGDGSGTWPGQVQPGNEPGCRPGGNCGGSSQRGSNCEGCCGNYNCDSCSGRDIPAHGLCGGIGPSGVNKTYYPAGTGDGNVPNIGTVNVPKYGPDSRLDTGIGIRPVYPGTQGITPESPVSWNSANPFLYGSSTPSSISHSWTGTTDKPIGLGNPFLDSNWNSPKPGYSNTYTDRNVIPHEEENIKPTGQGHPFLDGNKRGDSANPNEGVIPLGGKIPEGNNPFLIPVNENRGSDNPSYGKYPDRSVTSGKFPGSEAPGNYPGLGTPGNYPGSGTPGNYPGSGILGNYPGSGILGNYPGSGAGNYPASKTPGSESYGGIKDSFHSGGTFSQEGSDKSYSQSRGNPQNPDPLQCKLGLFGCGTPGSGSYAGNKRLEGAFGRNTENPRDTGNVSGESENPGIGNPMSHFTGAGHSGSEGNNLATAISGAQARAYAGSFSSAQASSSSFAGSSSGAAGLANNFGGNLSSSNGAQNQGGLNSWASSSASAFASSNAGSWSGNNPIDVKG